MSENDELQQVREALRALGDKLPPYEYAPELVRVIKAVDALEAQNAAQQQRIAALARLNRRANALLGSCWSLLQHVLSGHFPRPEVEKMVNELEAWNEALHADEEGA